MSPKERNIQMVEVLPADLQPSARVKFRSTDQTRDLGEDLISLVEESNSVSHDEEFKLLLDLYGNHPEVKRAILDLRRKTVEPSISDDVTLYMKKQAAQYSLLKPEEEIELFTDLNSSVDILNRLMLDQSISVYEERILIKAAIAHHTLVVSNLRMVIQGALVNYYPNATMSTEDIIQEGNIGLFRAIASFDINMGASFYGYAQWKVRSSIGKAMKANSGLVKIPESIHDKTARLHGVVSSLETDLGRHPTIDEIEHELPLFKGIVSKLKLVDSYKFSSFYDTVSPDNESSLIDEEFDEYIDIYGNSYIESLEYREMAEQLLSIPSLQLPSRERKILQLRFGLEGNDPQTLDEIGNQFNLSRERVRQLLESSFSKLKFAYFDVEYRKNQSSIHNETAIKARYYAFHDFFE